MIATSQTLNAAETKKFFDLAQIISTPLTHIAYQGQNKSFSPFPGSNKDKIFYRNKAILAAIAAFRLKDTFLGFGQPSAELAALFHFTRHSCE